MRYLLRAPFSLKRLDYDETSGQVRYRASNGDIKTWRHAPRLRKDKGMKQTELASLLDVHPTYVTRWETDRVTPRGTTR